MIDTYKARYVRFRICINTKKKMYKCKMIHFQLCKSARTFCHVMFVFLGDVLSTIQMFVKSFGSGICNAICGLPSTVYRHLWSYILGSKPSPLYTVFGQLLQKWLTLKKTPLFLTPTSFNSKCLFFLESCHCHFLLLSGAPPQNIFTFFQNGSSTTSITPLTAKPPFWDNDDHYLLTTYLFICSRRVAQPVPLMWDLPIWQDGVEIITMGTFLIRILRARPSSTVLCSR